MKSKDWRSWETLQCTPDDCCASGSKFKKKNKQFSNKGHGWNYCFECNKKQHYYWIMLENIVSVSCRSQKAFDRWPCKWIRIIFSSVNMCTKLEKDTLYGVHKVIPKRANNDLWPLKINKGCPLIMDNIYFISDFVIWKGRIEQGSW